MKARVLTLDGGTSYHAFSLRDPSLGDWFADRAYVDDITAERLEQADIVVVPCRLNPDWLSDHADLLIGVLQRGKTLVAMGETDPQSWIPGVAFATVPTNFWWWLDPDADLGLRLVAPDHGLFRYLTIDDATWHFHGVFQGPAGVVSLIDAPGGGSVLLDDTVSWPGRLILTSLDPFYHHGSFFMPAASRFLRGFTRWIGDGLPG